MVRSIRLRLVMGTMLLTLLTVSAVGVVALLLMQRYVLHQERAYLTANAEAIALQAADFMTPVHVAPPLQQLAQTAAFLGDVTVRIVDTAQVPLADSAETLPDVTMTSRAASPVYFRLAPAPAMAMHQPSDLSVVPPNVIWTLSAREFVVTTTDVISATDSVIGQEANVIVVQKSPSFWGDRLTFGAEAIPIAATIPMTKELSIVEGKTGGTRFESYPPDEAIPLAEDVEVATALVDSGGWKMKVSASDEMRQGTSAGATMLPSFLETVGFQATQRVTAPIQTGGSVIGFVELGRATNLVDEPLGAVRQALAIAAGASSLLAIVVGLVMSRTLTAPIQNLAQAAAAMSSGDLTARAPVVGRDELASLARQFNQMADALHHSFVELAAERDTLRRFVADASHELRTPITALRTFNELLQGPAREDRNAQAEFLLECHAQITRLEWITRNLLDLSRWDGGMATLTLADVEMGELVADAVAPFRTLAQERQIDLVVIRPEMPIVASVDEQRLTMALENLLDNALKFTPSTGKVEVGVEQDAAGVKIWVADTGMGIAAEELPHIFERFYRSPRATQAGSGLGLAIVERIVQAHAATIQVDSTIGAGSRFMLCFGCKGDSVEGASTDVVPPGIL